MAIRNPGEFKNDIKDLKDKKSSAGLKLDDKINEAKPYVDKKLFSYMKDLLKDPDIDPSLSLILDKKKNRWIFEVSFFEKDMINRQDATDLIKDIKEVEKAADLKSSIKNKGDL